MRLTEATTRIDEAVAGLDAWFETMHGPGGYGGPVAHWWQQSLAYTGPGLDWRYEGIIAGYLALWERTGAEIWLEKARRAGDDLVNGQLADGHYPASAFEINPASGGTPHEAAADHGLLLLAAALRQAGRGGGATYQEAAERNLREFYLGQLWDDQARLFRDSPTESSFVPNKAATVCDALFTLADLTGEAAWAERYALPTLEHILAHQVSDPGVLDGAIAQNSLGRRRIEKFFPIYIARCAPALLHGYRFTNHEGYLEAALRALRFIARWGKPDGSFPTVIYPNRQVNRYPNWIAPLGDILRAADLLRPHGFEADVSAAHQRLLAGQDASGGIQTATGFAAQSGGPLGALPDARDVLHVAGWCDKAFHYLAGHAGPEIPPAGTARFEVAVSFQGQPMHLVETAEVLEISTKDTVRYRWRKGEPWAKAEPEFWLH